MFFWGHALGSGWGCILCSIVHSQAEIAFALLNSWKCWSCAGKHCLEENYQCSSTPVMSCHESILSERHSCVPHILITYTYFTVFYCVWQGLPVAQSILLQASQSGVSAPNLWRNCDSEGVGHSCCAIQEWTLLMRGLTAVESMGCLMDLGLPNQPRMNSHLPQQGTRVL